MKTSCCFTFIFLFPFLLSAQDSDSIILRKIYTEALSNSKCYSWLDHLSNKIGGRLSGSDEAVQAVDYTTKKLQELEAADVYKQEVMVPHWLRGEKEHAE